MNTVLFKLSLSLSLTRNTHLTLSSCIALLIPSLFGTKEVAGPAKDTVRVMATEADPACPLQGHRRAACKSLSVQPSPSANSEAALTRTAEGPFACPRGREHVLSWLKIRHIEENISMKKPTHRRKARDSYHRNIDNGQHALRQRRMNGETMME